MNARIRGSQWAALALLTLGLACGAQEGCSRESPTVKADHAAADGAPLRFGALMIEVAHRFQLMGSSALAGRWDLAAYENDELGEIFTQDLPRAEIPEGTDPGIVAAMASRFASDDAPQLAAALKAHDALAFAHAVKVASMTCNACHLATGHGFIEVPSRVGAAVPDLSGAPPANGT